MFDYMVVLAVLVFVAKISAIKAARSGEAEPDTGEEDAGGEDAGEVFEYTIFRFLSLPRELRDLIYEHTFMEPDPIVVHATEHPSSALLHVCKQLRHEALPIYYLQNYSIVMITDYNIVPMVGWLQRYHNIEPKPPWKPGASSATRNHAFTTQEA